MTTSRIFVRCEAKLDYFFAVEIHPTRRKMVEAARRLARLDQHTGYQQPFEASCYSYRAHDMKGRITPELGTIFLHAGNLHPATLAHEFTHAAITFCRRRRLDPMRKTKVLNDAEERLATCVGWMMMQFYEKQNGRTFFVRGGVVQ